MPEREITCCAICTVEEHRQCMHESQPLYGHDPPVGAGAHCQPCPVVLACLLAAIARFSFASRFLAPKKRHVAPAAAADERTTTQKTTDDGRGGARNEVGAHKRRGGGGDQE